MVFSHKHLYNLLPHNSSLSTLLSVWFSATFFFVFLDKGSNHQTGTAFFEHSEQNLVLWSTEGTRQLNTDMGFLFATFHGGIEVGRPTTAVAKTTCGLKYFIEITHACLFSFFFHCTKIDKGDYSCVRSKDIPQFSLENY